METWEHQFHVGRMEDDVADVDVGVGVGVGADVDVDVAEGVAFVSYTTQDRACKDEISL